MKVLLVDDDEITLEMIRSMLDRFGYDVVAARDGQEAWDLVRTGQFRLVISDWEMPQMTGVELCRRVGASGEVWIVINHRLFPTLPLPVFVISQVTDEFIDN